MNDFDIKHPVFTEKKHSRSKKLLLLCYYDPSGISTVIETIAFIQQYSIFSITVMNFFEQRYTQDFFGLFPSINLNSFHGIIIHNSLSYNIDSLGWLLKKKLKHFQGIKVLMKQDENFHFSHLAKHIAKTKYDLIFTCLPEEAIPLIYPKPIAGAPNYIRMLTGYITPTMRTLFIPNCERLIDIGYRGSIQPLFFGRLAYEKRKIGYDVSRLLANKEFKLNISSRWEDRLGGIKWFEFLASCKATLGAESGASVFDLDGSLMHRIATIEKELGPEIDEEDYAEAYLSKIADLENKIHYNQISPRHFEAAATKTLQIMYPGTYSGIFFPGKHYVELKRDYSNLDEVLATLSDNKKRIEIVECAYEEIIQTPTYWIESFVENLDRHIEEILN